MSNCLANQCCLINANFTNTDMKDMILANSDLRGTILLGKNIETVNFEGAKFDNTTIWPYEFNPNEYGAIETQEPYSNRFTKQELINFAKIHIEDIKNNYDK